MGKESLAEVDMQDKLNEVCNVLVRARNIHTGEVVAERVGHNVWTNTGREYSCLLKTYNTNGAPFRNDRINFVGLGSGSQPETVNVSTLVSPIAVNIGVFLKEIDHSRTTFQTFGGVRTAVRYSTTFLETDISLPGGQTPIMISECGLFTDGNASDFTAGRRDVALTAASSQSPVAYHSFDPIPKTPNIQLDIIWELRH